MWFWNPKVLKPSLCILLRLTFLADLAATVAASTADIISPTK